MEIEIVPVSLDQRIAYLKQTAVNVDLNKKSFPWTAVIVAALAGAGICFAIIHYSKKEEEKKLPLHNIEPYLF